MSPPNRVRKRSLFSFSLRSALILLTVSSLAFGSWWERSKAQRNMTKAITDAGGKIGYAIWYDDEGYMLDYRGAPWNVGNPPSPTAPFPWIAKTCGNDFFATPKSILLPADATPEMLDFAFAQRDLQVLRMLGGEVPASYLQRVKNLPDLHTLQLPIADASDTDLLPLKSCNKLKSLEMASWPRRNVSEKAFLELGRALPQTSIRYSRANGGGYLFKNRYCSSMLATQHVNDEP